jgi:hypothetical protein
VTEATRVSNLPAPVIRQGGALVSVLEWEQHQGLSRQLTIKLADMIGQNPGLNTEERVDYLADLAGHYGEGFGLEFTKLVDEFKLERVYYAIDLLHELGLRSGTEVMRARDRAQETKSKEDRAKLRKIERDLRSDVARMLTFLDACDQIEGFDPNYQANIERLINALTEEDDEPILALLATHAQIERAVRSWSDSPDHYTGDSYDEE